MVKSDLTNNVNNYAPPTSLKQIESEIRIPEPGYRTSFIDCLSNIQKDPN